MTEDKGGEVVEMTPEQLKGAIEKGQEEPTLRVLEIVTDGAMVRFGKNELTPLEVRAAILMLHDRIVGK